MPISKYTIGVRYGLITGLIYFILLFCRYKFFAYSPPSFSMFAFVSYFIILMMYLVTGIMRKKELGGFAEFKEILQSVFIAILITELCYFLFNFIYLKYIDPGFADRFQSSASDYFRRLGGNPEQIDKGMKDMKTLFDGAKLSKFFLNYGITVIVDSVFGCIFALILRKKKTISDAPVV